MYQTLRYAENRAQTTAGGGIIVCDRTAALKNLIDNPLKDPVHQMVFELTKHAMVKALDRHSYITFVHKKVYGYKKDWVPDKLAKSARKSAARVELDHRIKVPRPLASGNFRFVNPKWVGPLLARVTIVRDA